MEKNRYRNMSEEKNQRLKYYQKNYCEAKKSQYNNEYNIFLIVTLIAYAVIFFIHIVINKELFN